MRIEKHPILKFKRDKKLKIYFEGKGVEAYEGETVAAALIAAGIKIFRYSQRYNRPRGFFCAIGKCSSCLMNIDGKPNQMACMKVVKDGMQLSRQKVW